MNMTTTRLPSLFVLIMPVLIAIACNRQKESSTVANSDYETVPFNPYYFKNGRPSNYAVKLKFKNGTYQVAENKIYKLPGRTKKKLNRPDGAFQLIYLDKNNMELGRFRTFSPREVLVEMMDSLASGFSASSIKLLDEVEFFLPLHPSGQTHSIRITEKGMLQEIILVLPVDTLDIVKQNNKLF